MARQSLATIKSWFKRGAKPTQQQFSDTFDSFVHKDDLIPQEKIEDFADTINQMQHDVDDAFANSIEEVKVNGVPLEKEGKSVNIEIGQSQADWEQNDEEADGYVKGRTHYEEKTEVISMEISGSDDRFEWPFTPEQGETYKLTYIEDDTEKTAYGTMSDVSPTQEHINFGSGVGAVYHIKGSNEGFWSGFATVESITVEKVDIHTLPEKYIPESIARKSELANVAHTGDYEDLENKPSIPDAASMIATHNAAQDAHNDIRQMALGASRGTSFTNIQALVTALNAASVDAYRVGDNLYIDTLEVSDLWIAAVDSTNVPYTYTSDNDFGTAVAAGRVQIGYFFVSRLEGGKVNIDLATQSVNGMMSAWDKTKLDGITRGATRVTRGYGFEKQTGWCMGSIYIWDTQYHNPGAPDDIILIYAPDVKVTNGTISANNGVIDLSAPIAGEIAAAVGALEGTLRGDYNSLIGNLSSSISNALSGISSELAQCKRNAPEISQSTTLVAGGFNDLGVLTDDVTLSLPAVTAGTAPEFNGQFTVDANGAFSVTFPTGVVMNGDTNLVADGVYQFSICNGYGVIVKMA
jgi:hypothetical protein